MPYRTVPMSNRLAHAPGMRLDGIAGELATAPATVEQLLALQPGDFIELDLNPLVQAKVDGVPVFDCHYGTSNGKYAIKIEQLLTNQNLSWLGENHG